MKKIFNLLLIFILMIIGLGFNSNFEYVEADAGQYNQTMILENLVTNGDLSDSDLSSYDAVNSTLSIVNEELLSDKNTLSSSSHGISIHSGVDLTSTENLFYISLKHKVDISSVSNYLVYWYDDISIMHSVDNNDIDKDINIWYENSYIYSSTWIDLQHKITWFFQDYTTTDYIIYYDDIMLFDLTATYGAGNEPSLAEFEILLADAPDYFETWSYLYYEYDPYISDFACERTMENMIENGDFSDGINDWVSTSVSFNVVAEIGDFLVDARWEGIHQSYSVVDHYYYLSTEYKTGVSVYASLFMTGGVNNVSYVDVGNWESLSYIDYANTGGGNWRVGWGDSSTAFQTVYVDNVMVFDLTAEWGAGNEPSLAEFELILEGELVDGYADSITFDDTCWMTVEQNNPIYQYNENIEIHDGQLNMVWTETILHDPLVNPSTDIYYIIEKYDLEMNYLGLIHDGKFGEWQSNADGYFYHDIDYTLPDPLLTEEGYIYVVYDSMGAGRKIYGAGYIFREPSTQFLIAYNDGTNDVRTLYDAIGVNNSPYLDIVSSYQFENNYDDYLFNENNPLLLTHIRINVTDYSTSDVVYYSENTTQEITLGIPFMYEKYCDLTMSRDWWNPLNTYECVYYLSEDDTLPYLFEYLNNNIIYTAYLVGVVDDYEINFLNVFDSVNYADNEGVYTYNILENDVNKKAIGETPFYHINYFHEMSIVNHQIRSGRNLYLDIHKYNNYIDTVFTYQYLYDNNTSVYEYDINNNEDQSFIMEVFEGLSSDDATIYYHLQNTDGVFKNGAVEDAYDVYVSDDYFMTFATSFPDKVDDWMDDLGMNSIIGKIIVSVSLLILATIFVFIYSKNIIIVLFVDFIIIALLAILGIIPLWIILVGIMLIFGGLFIKNRGRE